MPKKRNKKQLAKKKRNKPAKNKKAKNRSRDATVCIACGRKVPKEEALHCVCTRVVFCNDDCKRVALTSDIHDCQGAPGTKYKGPPSPFDGFNLSREEWKVPGYDDQKGRKEMIARVRRELGLRRDPNFSELKRLADNGHAEAAFLLAIRYTGRIQYTGEKWLEFDEKGKRNIKGCLETEALAVQYFTKSAKGGCPPAMYFLAMKLNEGKGIARHRGKSCDWAWKAYIHGDIFAKFYLDSWCMLLQDFSGTLKCMERIIKENEDFVRTHKIGSRGPNLATLMLSRWKHNGLIKNDFKFPAVCGEAAAELLIPGSPVIRAILSLLKKTGYEDQFYYTYGRCGSVPSATDVTDGDAKRAVDNQGMQLALTPKLVSEMMLTDRGINFAFSIWAREMDLRSDIDPTLPVLCKHMVKPDGTLDTPAFAICAECVVEAKQRLVAMMNGAYAIEQNPRWTNGGAVYEYEGKQYYEEFKFHSKIEMKAVLACLAADEHYNALAHPCFIAQDPNLIWPTLLYYGSIREALEQSAPKVDWEGKPTLFLGPSRPGTPKPPLVKGTEPGDIVYRCGSDICCKMVRDKRTMKLCGRCRRRSYCSRECQNADWVIHKRECAKTASSSSKSKSKSKSKSSSASASASAVASTPGGMPVVKHKLNRDGIQKWKCMHGCYNICKVCCVDFQPINDTLIIRGKDGVAPPQLVTHRIVKQHSWEVFEATGKEFKNTDVNGDGYDFLQRALDEGVPDIDQRRAMLSNYEACCMPNSYFRKSYKSAPDSSIVMTESIFKSESSFSTSVRTRKNTGSTLSRKLTVVDFVTAAAFACYLSGFSPMWIPRACSAMDVLIEHLGSE